MASLPSRPVEYWDGLEAALLQSANSSLEFQARDAAITQKLAELGFQRHTRVEECARTGSD